ncbi:lipoprotein [Spiroplasma endosymbiont of Panorpa germanica]|uniref:lipoprotein n=1 Tax=Spiroplasma endosymbiont of Panorpa germanica TaxID=3066314 RepID=UPI0030CDB35C
MRKLLSFLASISIVTSAASTLVSCHKNETFIFDGKKYNSREEIFRSIREEAQPFKSDEESGFFSTYKGKIYDNSDLDKLHSEILKNHEIKEVKTLKNLRNMKTKDDNEIISFVPEIGDAQIVEVYRDSNGQAVMDKKRAIESYLAGTNRFYAVGVNSKSYEFEYGYQLEDFIRSLYLSRNESGIRTKCYSLLSETCHNEKAVKQKIIKDSKVEYNLNGFKWDRANTPNISKMPNYLIEKYFDSFIKQASGERNTFVLDIKSHTDNFFGNTVITSDLSQKTLNSKLSDWSVVNKTDFSPSFGGAIMISKFFNYLIESVKISKDTVWSVKEDVFDNNEKEYQKFINLFNNISPFKIGFNQFEYEFSFETIEKQLSKIHNLDPKIKSMIFIKSIIEKIALVNNEDKEELLSSFDKYISELIQKIYTKNMSPEITNLLRKVADKNNFFNYDFLSILLSSSKFGDKENFEKSPDLIIKKMSDVVNQIVTIAGESEILAKVPEASLFYEAWKIAKSFSFFENRVLKLDLGNGQFLFYNSNDPKVPLLNLSLGKNPMEYINLVEVINNDLINFPSGGYFFLNTLFADKNEAIDALKKYIIKFPEKFKEVEFKITNNFEKFPNRNINNQSKEGVQDEIEKYAEDVFNHVYKGNELLVYTDGFGNVFDDPKIAIFSLVRNFQFKNYKKLIIPNNPSLNKVAYNSKAELYKNNKDFIDNVLAEGKFVLSTDLISNPKFDELKENVNIVSSVFQTYYNDQLYNFKTLGDAQNFIIRNANIEQGKFMSNGEFVVYHGDVFMNIKELEKFIDRKIQKAGYEN